ncbi:thioredoxin family protein [Lysobacter sp. MMG2]|uniref:thioredoxin family protein n=1 Tax=Lysobacter sp. MMG2 TaxID=2801338 RepID=UPI001C248F2D|nr:thioredoxin family protein [Lysobacter sp. MMG2]MBU8975093.1 thioredoxin family protein [Lysobacter sp. MMG2]
MSYVRTYTDDEPARAQVDAWAGVSVLEFGTNWCGYCTGAQPFIEAVLAPRDDVRHVKVEDGPGRPLGRSYRVKLWPTLIVLRDGEEVARIVRPSHADEIRQALDAIE